MICKNCNNEVADNLTVCPKCGNKIGLEGQQTGYNAANSLAAKKPVDKVIITWWLSLASICLAFVYASQFQLANQYNLFGVKYTDYGVWGLGSYESNALGKLLKILIVLVNPAGFLGFAAGVAAIIMALIVKQNLNTFSPAKQTKVADSFKLGIIGATIPVVLVIVNVLISQLKLAVMFS